MIHQILTKWIAGMAFEATNPGGNFKNDANIEIGGTNNGLRPKALLDTLASCTRIDLTLLLSKMKVAVDAFHIDVEGDLTEEHPKYYHSVRVMYHLWERLRKREITKNGQFISRKILWCYGNVS